MTLYKISLLSMFFILLITSTGFSNAYAAHGSDSSGGGGGCGNCTPPTLGVDSNGIVRVEGGLSINSLPFDVRLYEQNLAVQILNKDEKATVSLKIFEDEGANTVQHTELHFSPYDEVINGILVESSISHLVWHNELDEEIIGIYDENSLLQNVRIKATNHDGFKIIVFEFEPIQLMEDTTIMTRVWDDHKNVVNNYFIDAIKVIDKNTSELISDEKIPTWIKNNAGWWTENKVDDISFFESIEYLINNNIIEINVNPNENMGDVQNEKKIPILVKNSAKWWSDNLISEREFINSLKFLVTNKNISI